MPDTNSETNPEESFTFVDKRKVNAEAAVETDTSPDADADASETDESSEIPDDVDMPEEAASTSGDPYGSYGLVAYVTGLIASDAWQKMGLIADPGTGKVNPDMNQARFAIDCVAGLVGAIEQHKSNFPPELSRDLMRVLSDLRLNFVEQSRRHKAE